MVKRYLFLFMFLLTLSGCADVLLDSYEENFQTSVTLWGVEYSIKNTTELDLSYGGLSGPISPEIGELINLERLDLSRNQLTGFIPSEIGNLTKLEYLSLGGGSVNNQLTGEIPPEIGNLTNLKYLYLHDNLLTGEIPSEIGELSNLKRLNLSRNKFSGEIPERICHLSNIDFKYNYFGVNLGPYLEVEDNQLCPPYPSCVEDYIGDQNITNCWDCESDGGVELWGVCYSIDYTTRLDLTNSSLSGIIPSEISNLINLRELYLNENQLTGGIPSGIGNLANLKELYLNANQLTGDIPPEIGNLINLKELYLNDNQLTGDIPIEIGSLNNLKYLNLSGNSINGPIPSEIGNLTNLYQLNLSNNLLSGIIPDIICDLELRWYQEEIIDLFGQPVSSVRNNALCPTYPSCLQGNYNAWWGESLPIVGDQNTSNCN